MTIQDRWEVDELDYVTIYDEDGNIISAPEIKDEDGNVIQKEVKP